MLKKIILFLIMLMSFSCGKSDSEKTEAAIISANIYLSKGNCQAAIDVMEANGRKTSHAHYLKVLSSAYACRSGYSVINFFATDLALTVTPAPFGGTTLYSTAQVTTSSPLQNNQSFTDSQTAISLLLYAGGIPSTIEPTAAERSKYFTTDEAADINSQLLFMMLAQLGKYMHVYGNGDAVGIKGGGSGPNLCFTDYTDAGITAPLVLAAIGVLQGTCNTASKATHPELSSAIVAATRKMRLCQGVVLLNGIFNILPSVIGQLSTQGAAITAAASVATLLLQTADPSIGIVATTINQSSCEDNSNVPVAKLETYFAIMFESIFQ
jgi:hypothetical protein